MTILFSSYEAMKMYSQRSLMAQTHLDEEEVQRIGYMRSIMYGGLSGGMAGYVTTPFDVIKTQIMLHKTSHHGDTSMLKVAKEIYARRGVQGFFIGSVARSGWWFGVCSIFFPIYEGCKRRFAAWTYGVDPY